MKYNKQNLFVKASAFLSILVLSGLILTSCVQDFEGTKINYEQKIEEMTDNFGPFNSAWTGDVSIIAYDTSRASKKAYVCFSINSPVKLDMETVKQAVTFNKLKDNTYNPAWYPMHDGELVPTLISSNIEEIWEQFDPNDDTVIQKGVETTLEYDVDTEKVTTDKIALIVNATVLKDIKGNFVLNLDENNKAGQESDSWIAYLNVEYDENGNPTTSLSFTEKEEFRKEFNPLDPFNLSSPVANSTEPAKFDIEIPANPINEPGQATAYNETLGPSMIESFILRTIKPEDSTYTDVKLDNWTFDTNHYKATTPELAYGTKFKLIWITSEYSAPEWFTKVYGHPGYTDQFAKDAKIDLFDIYYYTWGSYPTNEATYIKDEPSFIVDSFSDPDSTAWAAGNYTSTSIQTNQKALLNVSTPETADSIYVSSGTYSGYTYKLRWTITQQTGLSNKVILDPEACDDFIVTDCLDSEFNKIDIVKTIVKNPDGSINKIFIETKYRVPYNSSTVKPKLWVGPGTKLQENKAHINQKTFGTFKDLSKGDASGYVCIYE